MVIGSSHPTSEAVHAIAVPAARHRASAHSTAITVATELFILRIQEG
ncbi:hypothetical protein SMD11_1400 [Streptomyces albireticuli]|uniref:Uncharacterized protein n=1 Tax=Streptomyces albireticuli TaxID=1940 RepID=A0A1Z2KYN8_9ACTN|nr:hypothetical protein SMD11_1400 [Streptomyces albireticuli]